MQLEKIRWRLTALDHWREDVDKRVSVMGSQLNDLRFTDAVAEALSKKLEARSRFQLTLLQKVGAGVFTIIVVAIPTVLAKLLS